MTRLLFILSCLLLASAPAAAAAPFAWGVNGHPMAQEAYRDVPVAQQIALVRQLGAGWYRCDWGQASVEKDPAACDGLVDEARRQGVHVLPVIFPSVNARSDEPPEKIRAAAFAFGKWIAARFRGRITHWELDNELDSFCMIRKGDKDRLGAVWQWGDADGDRPEQFEETRYRRVQAELQGLSEGVHAGDPEARTIVDSGGWLHTGFFERLVREDHTPFDIVGWHWYSEMGDPTKVRGSIDVLSRLHSFGKPVWVTEIDRRGGGAGDSEAAQAAYLAKSARWWRKQPGVDAFFVYELLDEPYFGADNPESHYGLVETVKGLDGRWRVGALKPAFAAMQRVLGRKPGKTLAPLLGDLGHHHFRPNPFGTQTTALAEGIEAGRLPAFLGEIAATGYGWVKDYIQAVAPPNGRSGWPPFPPRYEQFARIASGLGLKILMRVDAPRFDGKRPSTPEQRAVFAAFCRTAAHRLKPWVHDWEIENEPNIGNEKPSMSPRDYVLLVEAASKAIHVEDPMARVYGPASAMLQCLAPRPYPYIARLLDDGLLRWIDVFSFHPYRQPYERVNIPEHASEFYPWHIWGTYRRQIADLRSRLRAKAGRDVPLAATEVGWPTNIDRKTGVRQISLATQAKYEQRAMIGDFALGVRPRINFIFTRPWSDPYNVEDQFNLVNPDGSPRPARYAVTNVCAVFDDTLRPARVRVTCDASKRTNVQLHAFKRRYGGSELVIAVWAGVPADDAAPSHGLCRLKIAGAYDTATAYDLMLPAPVPGRALPVRHAGGSTVVLDVPLNDSPMVVVLTPAPPNTQHLKGSIMSDTVLPNAPIVHVVLFKWKSDTRPEQIEQIMQALDGLKTKVPGIVDFVCGERFVDRGQGDRAQGYTHGLVARFVDRAALEGYGPHAAHQQVVQTLIRPVAESVLAFDFEV